MVCPHHLFGIVAFSDFGRRLAKIRRSLLPRRSLRPRAVMAHRGVYDVLDGGVEDGRPDDIVSSTPSTCSDALPVFPIVAHEIGKHFGSVLDYLAILAWNRVVMSLFGGPTRTTIDVLMTRQFHGMMLVWTWVYTAVVSSVCVVLIRWSVGKRLVLEDEESRIELNAQHRSHPMSPPRFTKRFKAFALRRLASACTYVTMWAWAVALLGTAPANTLTEDFCSVLVLSLLFALVAKRGAKGLGPLGKVLKVTTERDLAMQGQAIPAENVEDVQHENEIANVTSEGVRLTCEWILAVAWVGAVRRGIDNLVGVRNERVGLNTDLVSQLVGWFVALLAVGSRALFLAARVWALTLDEPWAKEFKEEVNEVRDGVLNNSRDDKNIETSLLSSGEGSTSEGALSRGDEHDPNNIRSKIKIGVDVAIDASSMLAGAFAFTAGVALNAAAQTSCESVSTVVGVRQFSGVASAAVYAVILSTVTVFAATYAQVRHGRDDLDIGVGDTIAGDSNSGDTGDAGDANRKLQNLATKRKRRLLRDLAVDESKVGAFIAGFVWNAVFSQAVGDGGVAGWPWFAVIGWTAAAAGYAATTETWREVKGVSRSSL